MSNPLFLTFVLIGASCLYLFVIISSFRKSGGRHFSTPWLLLPLVGAAIVGLTLAFSIRALPATPVPFRLLELLAHLINILLLWTIAGKIVPANRLPATLLYGWNPLVLIELTVYANTAGVVICLLLLAVWFSSRHFSGPRATARVPTPHPPYPRPYKDDENGSPAALIVRAGGVDGMGGDPCGHPGTPQVINLRVYQKTIREMVQQEGHLLEIAALVLIGLAVRINFMALLIAPLLLWFMLRYLRNVAVALQGFAWRVLVVLAVFIVAYIPGWQGYETFLAITNAFHPFDFAYSPLSLVVMPVRALFSFVAEKGHFPPSLMVPAQAADMTLIATSFFLFALLYLREMGRVRADAYDTLFTSLAVVILGYIVLAATVFGPEYIVWVVWVVALRRFDALSVCALLLSCSALFYYPLQQFAATSTAIVLPVCIFGIPLVYAIAQRYIFGGRIERKKVLM